MEDLYKVIISKMAENHLKEIFDYISAVLHSPLAAENVLNALEKEILSLSYLPNRYSLTDRNLFGDLEVRKTTVHNYSVYYHVDEKILTVSVLAVLYARRDQRNTINELLS